MNPHREKAREIVSHLGNTAHQHAMAMLSGKKKYIEDTIVKALSDERKAVIEEIGIKLDALSDELFNACVDNPEMQLTWNSALRQSAYKVQNLTKAIRKLGEEE